MLTAYKTLTACAGPAFNAMLALRTKRGKESAERLNERKGQSSHQRPEGFLYWVHAASVGEAQSALFMIDKLLNETPKASVLITTGTLSSAQFLSSKLPQRCLHQFYPLDHPAWVRRFLNHWKPDIALWLESELWPNMLLEIKKRQIPALLINARMSDRSFQKWSFFKKSAATLLSAFNAVLCQTDSYKAIYEELGANKTVTTGNIKYSAAPLPYDEVKLKALKEKTKNRQLWLYASSHKSEEAIACKIHNALKDTMPNLLTIIVPRHPARKDQILEQCKPLGMTFTCRSDNEALPDDKTDIYMADTFGELGLFYRLCPVAVIGRSLSDDGGGGHNPIEAAQLECAILYGPNVQFQQEIYDEMNTHNAALMVQNEEDLRLTLKALLSDEGTLNALTKRGKAFTDSKQNIIDRTIEKIIKVVKTLPAA